MVWVGYNAFTVHKVSLHDDQWSVLEHLREDSDYWEGVHSFLCSMNGRPLTSLSQKQQEWYEDIFAALSVEVERREARITYGLEAEYD
jgi:hypothetical protein